MTSEPVRGVTVKNLDKNFDALEVLKDLSFDIDEGEFVCVVGPTGCGKTTFLNVLTCLENPTNGTILLNGEKADPRKHNLAFVFQESSAFPWLTVRQNIAYGLKVKRKNKDYVTARVNKIIELLGLTEYADQYPHQLSASAEQKIAIGRAFAIEPDLLLMDEPYGQMDIKMRFYLEDEVIRLWQELGATVIFITHNVEEAVYLAERVLILSQKPASIKEEVRVDLPRPRDVMAEEFVQIRTSITDAIRWW